MRQLMDLTGRVALVTGGCGKIGSVLGETLAELGSSVVVLDLVGEACDAQAAHLREAYRVEASALAVDLSDTARLQSVPAEIEDRFGRLDILVNCAALVGTSGLEGWVAPFEEQRLDAWRRAIEVNLTAPFALIQALTPLLAASGHGSVVNLGSIYGIVGPDWRLYEGTSMGSPAAYAASKGGLTQLTQWLATTLAPGIRVNAISPGGVYRATPEPFLSRYTERVPLRRMAVEEDLKGAVAYLASDLSQYVTGHNLVVDGGWTSW